MHAGKVKCTQQTHAGKVKYARRESRMHVGQ
jgi:hypothetical protein